MLMLMMIKNQGVCTWISKYGAQKSASDIWKTNWRNKEKLAAISDHGYMGKRSKTHCFFLTLPIITGYQLVCLVAMTSRGTNLHGWSFLHNFLYVF